MFDATSDFEQIADALETVVVTLPDGTETTVTAALRSATRVAEPEPSGGIVAQRDCHWRLPMAQLPQMPALGSLLRDAAGIEWTVLAVEPSAVCGTWKCQTRNLAIAHRLEARIAIETAAYGRDRAGAPLRTFTTWRANVPARVQVVARGMQLADAALVENATHMIFLAERDLPSDCRVRDAAGRIYDVLRIERADRLGQLTQLFARERT